MANIKLIRALEARTDSIPHSDGQFIITEQGNIYTDFPNEKRISIRGTDGKVYVPQIDDNYNLTWSESELPPTGSINIKGASGENGIGIETANISPDGVLFITLTDGTFLNVGSVRGPQGVKGEKGDPFTISKVYASVSDMESGFDTDGVPEGGFVIIETGNVYDIDNAKLYIKGSDQYEFITDLSGAQGIQGPKGDPGQAGTDGTSITITNIVESSADAGSNIITFSNGQTLTIKNGSKGSQGVQGEKGLKGDTGAQGPTGPAGANGTDGVPATHVWNDSTLVLTITSASGTSNINIAEIVQDKLDEIPVASSQGAIF